MTPPTATLTAANPFYAFTSTPGSVKFVATSGDTAGGTLIHEYKVTEDDPWQGNPNIIPVADKHMHFRLDVMAVHNRIELYLPGVGASVNLTL